MTMWELMHDRAVDPAVRPMTASPDPGQPPAVRTKSELCADIRDRPTVTLVVNARSRRGRRLYARACRLLRAEGFQMVQAMAVTVPGRLGDALSAAVTTGADLVVVGGGDGTLSEAANHLAYRDRCLGVLPLGTTNNFARSLGIPLGLDAAVRTLAHGKVADVDLGRCGQRLFTNLTSLGVSVEVAKRVKPALKRVLGRTAYPLTALRVLPGHAPFRACLTTGDDRYEVRTHQLNIANGRFHAGREIAGDASIDDRLLVVYRLGTHSRMRLVTATLRHALTGHRRQIADRPFLTGRDFWLEADPPQLLDVDGEVRGSTPIQLSLAAEALRVMVPLDFVDI